MMRVRVSDMVMIASMACLFGCGPGSPTADRSVAAIKDTVSPELHLIDSLTRLIDARPNDADLLNQRANVYLDIDQVDYALTDVGKALLMDSSVADYYLTVSDVYFRMNMPDRCLKSLTKANRLAPELTEPLYRLAQFKLYLREYQPSIDYANQILAIDAHDDRPFMIKGLCFKELGDTAQAISNYLKATSENPDNYDAMVELGVLHWAKNDPLAEQYLKSALRIKPNGIDALYALGMYYQQADKLNLAMQTYTHIIEVDSTIRSAHFNIGYIQYQYLQMYDEALKHFDDAVKSDPKYYQAIYMRGLCYEAKGDIAKAKREYGFAIEINPDYVKAADGLNRLLSKKK